ncbi:MAG: ankyrin repeat domain-containing protein [Bacteroidota bacterium]
MKIFGFLIVFSLSLSSCAFYLPGFDFELFKNTPAEKLADAVEDEDLDEIDEILRNNRTIVDYQEPEFGHSLLVLATVNNKLKSTKKLLELGADPNLKSFNDSSTAVIDACDGIYSEECNLMILQELIKHGGNVNIIQHSTYKWAGEITHRYMTPLLNAIGTGKCIEVIKLLVESGADVNYVHEISGQTPVIAAIMDDRLDVARYLIIEKKANTDNASFTFGNSRSKMRTLTIKEILNEKNYNGSDNSENLRLKQEILDFLKAKGLE